MRSTCTLLGAVVASVLLASTSGAAAVDDDPSPLPTQAYPVIQADKQLNVGSAARSVDVGWMFYDGGAQVPVPTNETIVIDARDLAGIASVTVDDPKCEDDGQVITCADMDSHSIELTLRAQTGAATGADGTITYTVSADHADSATAKTKVVVGVPSLVVGRVPDVTDAEIGSRVEVPLRIRNTGDLATDRRIMLRWESVGGLVFDRKFSNCRYGDGDEPLEPGGQASVTCLFPAGPDSVPAGATVELSSPLTATVGDRVLTAVNDYSVELVAPGVTPGGGYYRGTGPALTLVRASGAGSGFEKGTEGRFTVAADNSADLAARATTEPGRKAGEWILYIDLLNHGPASAYGIDRKSVAVVDVALPKGAVAIGNAYTDEEDTLNGPCHAAGSDSTARFEAGHRNYVCTVPVGVRAGKSQPFILSVRTSKAYDGGKGTATVRPGPAGIPLHDPDAANDSVTFALGAAATPTAAQPSGDGSGRTTLIATAAGCTAALLGGVVMVVRRRRRSY